jgi:voltage-gated potassium channel
MSQSQHSTSTTALTRELLERLIWPVLMVVIVFLFGTFGFLLVGAGKWSLFDCAYMTSITLTTVGYGEILEDMGHQGRTFAMVLMWTGMGVTLYAISTITGFVVEQNFTRILRERKMEKRIAAMKDHFIVCGMGKTGFNVLKELMESKRPCVIIEIKPERIEWIRKQFQNLHFIQGDATEEEVLRRAGIERASGILAALGEDSHNLLITVQARYVNPATKIVARCQENNLADKFYRAGANYVVNPAFIGGMRMASEMVRPNVVSFLDRMLRGKDKTVRVEEVELCEGSPWIGKPLVDIEMREKTGLIPISIKNPEDEDFRYNPSKEEVLKVGTVMIVIGNPEQIAGLRKFCSLEDQAGEPEEDRAEDENE